MGPADAGVHAADDDVLAREAQGPDLRGLDVVDACLHRVGRTGTTLLGRRQDDLHARVAVDAGHVRALGQVVGQGPVALHPDHVDDVVRTVLHTAGLELVEDRALRRLGLLVERLVDEAPLLQLGRARGRARQVGLVGQDHRVLGPRSALGVPEHPGRDLGQGLRGRAGERRQAQPGQQAQDGATKGHGSSLQEKSQPGRIAGPRARGKQPARSIVAGWTAAPQDGGGGGARPSCSMTSRSSSAVRATGGMVVAGRSWRGLASHFSSASAVQGRSPGAVGG